jgi:peptidoglycan/xylan/chitin deacetylase (PgdA/CDA1 family)
MSPWKHAEMLIRGRLTGAHTRARPGGNRIYLTYDDGPDPEVTPELLEILRRHDARATFFVLASGEPWWEESLRRIAADGHRLALHGLAHRSAYLRRNAALHSDLAELEQRIARAGLEAMKIYRPPYGDVRPDTVGFLRDRGYATVLWTALPGDYRRFDQERLFYRAIRDLEPGSILALHDGTRLRPAPVLDLTRRLLEYCADRGMRAEALREEYLPTRQRS